MEFRTNRIAVVTMYNKLVIVDSKQLNLYPAETDRNARESRSWH